MDLRDFRTVVASGVVDRVILVRVPQESWGGQSGGYELWAFSDTDEWPRHLGNRLTITRSHEPRTWASVDRALGVIRDQGWLGTVEVEEPVRQVNPAPAPPAGAYQV
jgi:hypothetical protein